MSGDEFMKKADGKANAFFFKDYDGAYDYYIKAAGCYKADKQLRQAGDAFMKAGDVAMRLKNSGDAMQAYAECAKLLRPYDMVTAKACMDQAVKLNITENRLGQAARLLKDWGEALESDNPQEALAALQKARQYFDTEDQPQAATQVLSRIANIYLDLNRYEEAMQAFEKLGNLYTQGTLKFQAKSMFFLAVLCRLATIKLENLTEGCSEARDALEAYLATDGYFRNTRESEACEMLIDALENSNEETFDEAVGNLQDLKMLDDKKTSLLLKIRQNISDTR